MQRRELLKGVTAAFLGCTNLVARESFPKRADKLVVLGISGAIGPDNAEFVKDSKLAAWYRTQGISANMIGLERIPAQEELKQYNVILLVGRELDMVSPLTEAAAREAESLGRNLANYVADGGGLLLLPNSTRYPNNVDEKYWNLVFKLFDAHILHEGIFDLKNQAELSLTADWGNNRTDRFFYTSDIAAHPATDQVHSLWLPLHSYNPNAGTVAMQYGPAWQVLIRGEDSAESFISDPVTNLLDPAMDKVGTYRSAPPIVAVRSFDKGRVSCLALDVIHAGQNYLNPFWSDIVESAGDPKSGRKSDGMLLIAGLVKWLGMACLDDPAYGTLRVPPYQQIQFPSSCNFDTEPLAKLPLGWWKNSALGILGAHSAHSDGRGSVAEYVTAAKAAGLSFIVFTDPLEALTQERLKALKTDCQRHSDDAFYACPGVEFNDGAGIRWALWHDGVKWPPDTYTRYGETCPVWNAEKRIVQFYGAYQEVNEYRCSAVIDYKRLHAVGAFPENMWWFFNVFPYAYDRSKLIADNTQDFLFALRDLRATLPMPYTKILSPSEVESAKQTAMAGVGVADRRQNLEVVKRMFNGLCSVSYSEGATNAAFVSYGGFAPVILRSVNSTMSQNWQYTRGAQRIRMRVDAHSDTEIKEIKLLDPTNDQVLRRFLPASGTTDFSQSFELVHDQQHWVIAEMTHGSGSKSYSNTLSLYCYKQGLFRCGDNLNILGPLGYLWHPDRMQQLPINKDFRNAELLSIQGWDRGEPDCPRPMAWPLDTVNIRGVGQYPNFADEVLGMRMDVQLAGHNIQIVAMREDDLMAHDPRGPGHQSIPEPAWCSIARKVAENEYFQRWDRMIAPKDRMDHYVAWDYQRLAESIRNYKGDFMWHEGHIRFKKNAVLRGSIPVPLGSVGMPIDLTKGWGNKLVALDAGRGAIKAELRNGSPIQRDGRLVGGGYAAIINNPIGYIGILVPAGYELNYHCELPGKLTFGIGRDGQIVHAGEILKYAYIAADIIDDPGCDGAKMHTLSRAFNLDGKGPGYPIQVKTGKLVDSTYFLTLQAYGGEAVFTAGPQKDIGIDLPIRIQGCEGNGCAAVYSTCRPRFRFVAVMKDTVYFQEPIDSPNELWVGNVFVCDNPKVKLTLVVDGQDLRKPSMIEVHNPTDQAMQAKLASPPHTPHFGGISAGVALPPGASVFYRIETRELKQLEAV